MYNGGYINWVIVRGSNMFTVVTEALFRDSELQE
jgi:hypothetical protein